MSQASPSPNKPIYLLLAALLAAGVIWMLWPKSDSAGVADSDADGGDSNQLELVGQKSARRDLAREAKASVSGTVRAVGGAPLADAQVCATPVRNQLRGLGQREPKCARSGNDGHYRIEGLWPVRTQLSASAANHEPKNWRAKDDRGRWRDYVTLAPDGEATKIDFELKTGGVKLAGFVRDLGGGEIEGAVVMAGEAWSSFGNTGSAVAVTDAEGHFELWVAAGVTGLTATAEGYGSGRQEALAPSERVELFLTPESVLVGQVVHAETGEPVGDVTVSPNARGGGDEVRSDADGRFRIGGLAPGTYKPVATEDHFYGEAATQVHLGLGQTSESVEIRVHPMALIEGRIVLAGTEEGCRDGWVRLTRTDKGEWAMGQTDDEGRVLVRGVRPGEYEVEVRCSDRIANDDEPNITVAADDVLGVVWEVRDGQAIRGVVVDGAGEPVDGASLAAQMVVDAANPRAQTTSAWSGKSEPDGTFELAGLLAGSYEVTAMAKQPGPDTPTVVELAVGSDRNDVRIELLATGTIKGRVVDERGTPQPGGSVRAAPLGKWGGGGTMCDDEGNFVLEHVRTGEVRIRASTGMWGGDSMRAPGTNDDDVQGEMVSVGAGETIEVELQVEARTGVIRGKVVDEGGATVDDAFIHAERMSDSATASAAGNRNAVRWERSSEPILSDVDGTFTIDELAEGTYVVRAHRRGGGEAIVEGVALGSSIELKIAPTGVLAGTVEVTGAEPPEKFSISIMDKAQGLSFRDTYFRTEGVWEIGELPPGSYEVNVESNLGTGKLEAIELEAGGRREDLELVLQPRVTVRGRVVDIDTGAPVAGMEVGVSPRTGGFSTGSGGKGDRKEVSDADGRFEVEHAPTGSVSVRIYPRSGGRTSEYDWTTQLTEIATEPSVQDIGDIEVVKRRLDPEQVAGDLGFELKQPEPGTKPEDQTLTVALIRPGGPAAASELAVGDVIEAVDGKSVVGLDSIRYRQLVAVAAGTVLEFTVDGKPITITVGPPIK